MSTSALLASFGIHDLNLLPSQVPDQSIPFEPHLVLDVHNQCDELERLAERVRQRWLAQRQRMPKPEKQRQFVACVELILLNLLRADVRKNGLLVGIGTGKQHLDAARRYNPAFMSVDYFREARDLLLVEEIIVIVQPGYQNDGLAQVARYRLTDGAKAYLLPNAPGAGAFNVSHQRESIVLKDANGRRAKYDDNEKTTAMRAALNHINEVIAAASIGSIRAPRASIDLEDGFNPYRTRLYRVFNNSSFDEGGRFYGGWWQHARRHFRPLITLNGEATVEVDFKGLHPSMLFARAGLPIPADPYALVQGAGDNATLRDHAKTTFMALLNAGNGGTKEPRNFDAAEFGVSAEGFRERVKSSFPMLPGIFGSGVGLRLQRQDSDLAERIMLYFVERDIPILPVHDSFIVAERHREELVQVMKDVFAEAHGQSITVSVKASAGGEPA
jgi:hypothetical protein